MPSEPDDFPEVAWTRAAFSAAWSKAVRHETVGGKTVRYQAMSMAQIGLVIYV